jgi:predicted transcriptional regulator of viral defense system
LKSQPAEKKLIAHARRKGIIRTRELKDLDVPRVYLTRIVRDGRLDRISRGLYRLPDSDISSHQTMIQVAKRIPNSVICLLSALNFHEVTTQIPRQVWIAMERGTWKPNIRDLPIRIFQFSGKSFREGIVDLQVNGVSVRVYNPAKTVADCFKYRNKIGLDVAIEAVREVLRKRKATVDEIVKFARICRVFNVMRPYLEATTLT